MKSNNKFWLLFAIAIALSLGTQLVGQEVEDKKVVKKEIKKEYRNKQDMRQRQMMMNQRRKQMRTRTMIQDAVWTLAVAGVSYYIGYKVGEDSWMDKKKDGGKKPPIWRDK